MEGTGDRERLLKLREDGLITQDEFERLLRSSQPGVETPRGPSESTPPAPLAPPLTDTQPAGRSRRFSKLAAVSVVAVLVVVAAAVGVVLLAPDSEDGETSLSVETTPIETTSVETTPIETISVEDEPVVVSINVEMDSYANPIPPNLEITLGSGAEKVTSRLFEGTNRIEIAGDFLAEKTNTQGEIRVRFSKLAEDSVLFPSRSYASAFVRDPSDPSATVTLTDDGISMSGPWLAPFEIDRPNPIRDAECDEVIKVLDKSGETADANNLIKAEFDPQSSLEKYRDNHFAQFRNLQEYLIMVSALDWVYFNEYEDLEPLLRERVDLHRRASVAFEDDVATRLIDSLNGLLPELNRLATDIAIAWNDTCI